MAGKSEKALALPKSRLLSRPWQYKKVYDGGTRLRGPGFSLIFLGNEAGNSRLGISVHGARSAVRRNRIKRIVREFFRRDPAFLGLSVDVVFAVRHGFALDSPGAVEEAVRRVLAGGRQNGGRKAPGGGVGTSLPVAEITSSLAGTSSPEGGNFLLSNKAEM